MFWAKSWAFECSSKIGNGILTSNLTNRVWSPCSEFSRKIIQKSGKMFVSKSIPVEHKDLIHDVSYDFHGKRMATCSSDQIVKVPQFSLTSCQRFPPSSIFFL